MKIRGVGTFSLALIFVCVLLAARFSLLSSHPTLIHCIGLISLCLVPALALSFAGAQVERVAMYRSQALQMVGTIVGMYLVLCHPDFLKFLFSPHSFSQCSTGGHIWRVVNHGLFLGALLGGSIIFTLGIAEVMLVWIGQLDRKTFVLPHSSGRIVYFVLVLTLLGERIAALFFDRIFFSCTM